MEDSPILFRDYGMFLKSRFPFKVQKLSIDGGFGCPNRDGRKGRGGCTYCNNLTFTPGYCDKGDSVSTQIRKGMEFFGRKYPGMKYLAYFQAHTNTYAPTDVLKAKYEEALGMDNIVGLVVGTRPDCVGDKLLDYLGEVAKRTFVMVEYGVESTDDNILMAVNRGHGFAQSRNAIARTAARGISTCAHIILGLPGATRRQMLAEPSIISELPVDVIKLHQLQIVDGTAMARQYRGNPGLFPLFRSPQDYAEAAIDYIERLRPDIALERFTSQSPADLLIAPKWGIKNYLFTAMLRKKMEERRTWQGRLWQKDNGETGCTVT